MKTSNTAIAERPKPPVFSKTLHELRRGRNAAIPNPKAKKRDNTFSKSRDTREDRGRRQMKNTRNSQTFARGR
jgi:hypothetical protein